MSKRFPPRNFDRFIGRVLQGALREVGTDREALLRLIRHEGEFRRYVIEGIRVYSSPTPGLHFARKVMGNDFISPEEVTRTRGVVYSSDQISLLERTMPSSGILGWCKEHGFALVPGPSRPMSFLEICELEPGYFSRFFCNRDWSRDAAPFAHDDKVGVGWFAFRTAPTLLPAMGWNQQRSLVPSTERVPNIAEVAWCITTYRAIAGLPFPFGFVRTNSVDQFGTHVSIGSDPSNGGGLVVYPWSDEYRSEFVGLATVRNIP